MLPLLDLIQIYIYAVNAFCKNNLTYYKYFSHIVNFIIIKSTSTLGWTGLNGIILSQGFGFGCTQTNFMLLLFQITVVRIKRFLFYLFIIFYIRPLETDNIFPLILTTSLHTKHIFYSVVKTFVTRWNLLTEENTKFSQHHDTQHLKLY